MNTYEIWRSGLVRRWHANPDMAHTGQTNAQHQWGCAVLALALFPDDPLTLRAALLHDVGEVGVGDLASPAKKANPALLQLLNVAEADNMARLGVELVQDARIRQRLHLVDRLEAWLWVQHTASTHHAKSDEWSLYARRQILAEADDLGVVCLVEAIIVLSRR
jgi:hypothetical protein